MEAHLIGGKIFSNDKEAINLNNSNSFGKKEGEKVYFSKSESLYLLEKKLVKILDHNGKELLKKDLYKKFSKESNFKLKYVVYKDLKESGLIPKEALKYGTDFRVYKSKQDSHSTWLVKVESSKSLRTKDLLANTRIANTSKKNLLLAIVDEENSVTYLEIKRIKP